MKQIFVLGGTGRTGQAIIRFALKQGHQVKATARDLNKVPQFSEGTVEWFKGSATDKDSMIKASQECEVFLSAIGNRGFHKTTLFSDSIKVIMEVIK